MDTKLWIWILNVCVDFNFHSWFSIYWSNHKVSDLESKLAHLSAQLLVLMQYFEQSFLDCNGFFLHGGFLPSGCQVYGTKNISSNFRCNQNVEYKWYIQKHPTILPLYLIALKWCCFYCIPAALSSFILSSIILCFLNPCGNLTIFRMFELWSCHVFTKAATIVTFKRLKTIHQ